MQGQGRLENIAIREHFSVNKKNVSELPGSVSLLIKSWLEINGIYAYFF
jgi:hypothetical protein